jgi:hypothetical protein
MISFQRGSSSVCEVAFRRRAVRQATRQQVAVVRKKLIPSAENAKTLDITFPVCGRIVQSTWTAAPGAQTVRSLGHS